MNDIAIKRTRYLLLNIGGLVVLLFLRLFNKTIQYTSSNYFRFSCHVHSHAEASWKLSVHNNNSSGMSVNCVDCYLPPEEQKIQFISRKAYHG